MWSHWVGIKGHGQNSSILIISMSCLSFPPNNFDGNLLSVENSYVFLKRKDQEQEVIISTNILLVSFKIFMLSQNAHVALSDWQVSNLASEAKRERNALTKEVTKISNYGISVWEFSSWHSLVTCTLNFYKLNYLFSNMWEELYCQNKCVVEQFFFFFFWVLWKGRYFC